MTQVKRSISVVIPNYCGKELLEKYLPSVFEALSFSKNISDYEVIVVDDCSTDNSISFLKATYPNIMLLENEKNKGFSISINKGIFAATKELVFLLNTDMQLPADIFDKLCPFFDKTDTFGVFPTVKDFSTNNISEAQKLPNIKSDAIHYIDNKEQADSCYTFYLCGGNALVSREKIRILGGFNTIYSPFYFEDFDLCLRAWKQDWKSYYTPDSYCLHYHSATINENFKKEEVEKIFIRNRMIFNYLHAENTSHLIFIVKTIFKYLFASVLPSKSRLTFKDSFLMAVTLYPTAKKSRKEEKKNQRYSLKEICLKYFNPTVRI
jgi:GT2 family glycosyltransferase